MTDQAIRRYLDKRADLASRPLVSAYLDGIGQVVAIPVLAEKEHLFQTLASLAANPGQDLRRTLVICVVNNRAEPFASRADVENNLETLDRLDAMVGKPGMRLAYVDASSPGNELPKKGGVGLARKLGLDLGASVLEKAEPPRLLISLDADTCVEPNYLPAIRHFFEAHRISAATISYAHRLDGPPEQAAAILCYEIFLRYHVLGLEYAGSPYAYHVIGSAMACTAEAYAAVSGMNQRQAGEDFYFLQQLAKTAGIARVTDTTVHPSSRGSERVPFGTGKRVRRFLSREQDEYLLYDPRCYRILKDWLALVASDLGASAPGLVSAAGSVAPELEAFLEEAGFGRAWERLRENSASPAQLHCQFHRWFDGFRTLKLIHYLRDNGYPERGMFDSVARLLAMAGVSAPALDWGALRDDVGAQRGLAELMRQLRLGGS